MGGIGHPGIQLEQMLRNFIKQGAESERTNGHKMDCDEEPSNYVLPPINLCEWSVDQARRHPILGRAVTPCYVDMVQLPGVFLKHPSVLVEESENEMIISDRYTKEFIAKKIIYD